MIIQFTIGNFLSFKEQSTLSLAASALKKITYPESMEEFQLSEI